VAYVVYADGPTGPRVSPSDALAAAGSHESDTPPELLLGWTLERHHWLDDPDLRGSAVLAGYGLAGPVADGRLTPLPIRLSAVPALLRSRPPDVGVVAAVRRGRGYAYSGSIGWADVVAEVAGRLVLEIDEEAVDLGGPAIDADVVATLPRPRGHASTPVQPRSIDEIDLAIGTTVASLLPDDATLQFGPGGIGEGIARALDRPVRIWSGLCTAAMASLHDRDLLLAPVVAAYTQGGLPIRDLAMAGMLDLTPSSITHDISRLSSIERFVGCNTALQVGLDGSVNVERVGHRTIAAIGGHSDFCAGASRSVGGLSIIAVRSTTNRGESTIVERVDVVSTQRSDVDVVVTEHGVADLRGVDDAERAERLIAVATPDARDRLRSGLG
jgi:Acetyl-CoA hydrolase/transferase C-terminal domain